MPPVWFASASASAPPFRSGGLVRGLRAVVRMMAIVRVLIRRKRRTAVLPPVGALRRARVRLGIPTRPSALLRRAPPHASALALWSGPTSPPPAPRSVLGAVLPPHSVEDSCQVTHKIEPAIVGHSHVRLVAPLTQREVLLDLALHGRIPVILDGVVGTAVKEFGDLGPSIPEVDVTIENDPILPLGPRLLGYVRVEVIVPPLAALFPYAAGQV
mmetsp:Transcript_18950/g.54956  ORF Transcript_18950/g.54956 Transcript_18950/m.54956 type:complete len:214 (+) Transcript_18950:2064-2705(+)